MAEFAIPPTITFLGASLSFYKLILSVTILIFMGALIYRTHPLARAAVYHTLLAGIISGVIVARAVHVLLNIAYFRYNMGEAFTIGAGGLDWRGATIGAIVGVFLMARRYPALNIRQVSDQLAFGVPLIGFAAWAGCDVMRCAYGTEIPTLTDYPAVIVHEAPDIFGFYAARFYPHLIGMLSAIGLMIITIALNQANQWHGRRLWLVIALWAGVMFGIGFLRGDYALMLFGLRAGQWVDLTLGAVMIGLFWRDR